MKKLFLLLLLIGTTPIIFGQQLFKIEKIANNYLDKSIPLKWEKAPENMTNEIKYYNTIGTLVIKEGSYTGFKFKPRKVGKYYVQTLKAEDNILIEIYYNGKSEPLFAKQIFDTKIYYYKYIRTII